jgi:hypothetical protein
MNAGLLGMAPIFAAFWADAAKEGRQMIHITKHARLFSPMSGNA